MKAIRLLPFPQVQGRTNDCKAQTYALINNGLFPPPVKIGRKSVWPENEVEAVVAARIAGASVDELRQLIENLVAQRRTRYEALTARSAWLQNDDAEVAA